MYTVGNWLIPRKTDGGLIEIMQPVAPNPDSFWTDNVNECIEWFLAGEKRRMYSLD
jgi:hypothetical protein